MSYSGNVLFLGQLDNWTFFKNFFDQFWTNIWTIFWVTLLTICGGGGERGRKTIGMRQTFITQGGVGDGLLIRMEGWEVVVVATASY